MSDIITEVRSRGATGRVACEMLQGGFGDFNYVSFLRLRCVSTEIAAVLSSAAQSLETLPALQLTC